jgi:aspartate kinase
LLTDAGVQSRWVDAREVVRTDDAHGAAVPDVTATRRCVDTIVRPWLARDRVVVLGGFVGSAPGGATTTLGRGGSDYSAALLGACLSAEEIQIWTDVDGVLTADPRLVADARSIPRLSYESAYELARFGAKVLHPGTIAPAAARRIPVRVLNARRPAARGTVIAATGMDNGDLVTAVTCRTGLALLEIVAHESHAGEPFAATALQALAAAGGTAILADICGGRVSVAVEASFDVEPFRHALSAVADVRRRENLAAVCLVGEGLSRNTVLLAEILGAMRHAPVHLVGRPSGATTLALMVDQSDADRIVADLHHVFLSVRQSGLDADASEEVA